MYRLSLAFVASCMDSVMEPFKALYGFGAELDAPDVCDRIMTSLRHAAGDRLTEQTFHLVETHLVRPVAVRRRAAPLVARGFTPKVIRAMEPHIREAAKVIVDRQLGNDDVIDFVPNFAAELPLVVIAELLGIPYEDRHKIFEWSNRLIGNSDPEYNAGAPEQAMERRWSSICTRSLWLTRGASGRWMTSSPR